MPVGRTAGSMIMAVVTVVVQVCKLHKTFLQSLSFGSVNFVWSQTLEPEEAFLAIEYGTLALLWGMMVLVEYLKDDALFDMFINKVKLF